VSLPGLLEAMVRIAGEAAGVVLDVYGAAFDVDYKGADDPVTAADRRANALICERLTAAYPDIPVVAEESPPESFAAFRDAERVFFVDPLDGTREFIDRIPEFAVMIGLVVEAQAAAGVIHAPARGVAWAGAPGLGAWQVGSDGARAAIRVTGTGDLAASRVVASRSHRSQRLERVLAALGARELIAMGGAGFKGAMVASGNAEVYIDAGRGSKRWDACATDAVVTAAGGRLTDTAGRPIDYRAPGLANEQGMVATNGRVHDEVLARIVRTG
jgi:3'(2'), 5'-bisphosphate nucleotidase